MKVAIVHYWFITRRGGEKVVESLLKIFPEADIYTLFYDRKRYGDYLGKHRVFTSILNKPYLRKHYQKMFPLYPFGLQSLKLKEKYDLIISSESGPAKGIKIPEDTPHICYMHTPLRYCYSHRADYIKAMPKLLRQIGNYFLNQLQKWDQQTIDNVNLYIANSVNTANRIKKFYNKPSVVLHPPIADHHFIQKPSAKSKKEYYLSFGAITPYKRIDILIDAFANTDQKLLIIGEGSERKKLMKKAGNNVTFTGALPWDQIVKFFEKTKALLFPGEEDFGLIPLEVMAYGIPVIAYKKGGALETVIENRQQPSKSTGTFFKEQSANSVLDAIRYFEEIANQFDRFFIQNHAMAFRESVFIDKFNTITKQFLKRQNL
ncbi:MAG: glycosyl transferase [Flavobacteriales bacterium]|nr:MAG: glycosyl transferase [Flavobacteriales bacterium]